MELPTKNNEIANKGENQDESKDKKKDVKPTMELFVIDRKPLKPNASDHYNGVFYTSM